VCWPILSVPSKKLAEEGRWNYYGLVSLGHSKIWKPHYYVENFPNRWWFNIRWRAEREVSMLSCSGFIFKWSQLRSWWINMVLNSFYLVIYSTVSDLTAGTHSKASLKLSYYTVYNPDRPHHSLTFEYVMTSNTKLNGKLRRWRFYNIRRTQTYTMLKDRFQPYYCEICRFLRVSLWDIHLRIFECHCMRSGPCLVQSIYSRCALG